MATWSITSPQSRVPPIARNWNDDARNGFAIEKYIGN
jgi:hypothetical protein